MSTTTTTPMSEEDDSSDSSDCPIFKLPLETLHQIFSTLPLTQITLSKTLSKFFLQTLSSSSFLRLHSSSHPPLSLLSFRHHLNPHPILLSFHPLSNSFLSFHLSFLPFLSPSPVSSSNGLVYLWAESVTDPNNEPTPPVVKSLVVCNPVTRRYRVLPRLGSAWWRHGSVLVDEFDRVLVLTELATLYLSDTMDHWLNVSSNLPAKPRSPILVKECIYALCDVGSPWRSQWKLYYCDVARKDVRVQIWSRLEMAKWGDVFDVLKRPRLVKGDVNSLLMVGGLKASFALHAPCSAIVVLRLDLDTMEWTEAARMPAEMFMCFPESSKFKVFGGGNCVCFSGKKVGKLALWQGGGVEEADDEGNTDDQWRWIEGLPGNREGTCRGFIYEASLHDLP